MLSLPYDIHCGYFDSTVDQKFFGITDNHSPKRIVNEFELEFFSEDGYTTYLDDNEYKLIKGTIMIAVPGQIRWSILPFKTHYVKFKVDGLLAQKLNEAPTVFICTRPDLINSKIDELILLSEKNDNEVLLYSRLLAFLDLVLHDSTSAKPHNNTNYDIIRQAKRFIEANYANPIHLEDIASSVNLSPIYFHNIFSSICGKSPHDYLLEYRIDEAKKQLWNPDITIAEIAENCGFGSQQYFTKIFKKETGASPGKYRKTFHQNYYK